MTSLLHQPVLLRWQINISRKNSQIGVVQLMSDKKRVILIVEEIKGNCVVFSGGERITIDGPQIDLNKTDKICIHALAGISNFILPLQWGISPKEVGLHIRDGNEAYFQCLDPGPPYTDGGTVLFRIKIE